MRLCDACWPGSTPHRAKRSAPAAKKHEKINLETLYMVQSLMGKEKNLPSEHLRADRSRWFGISFNDQEDAPVLDITDRYRKVALANTDFRHREAYPALVSFVGETGAGKSSLVAALVKVSLTSPDTPVIGDAASAATPTSSDVHLFADPGTRESERPLLFADCEGLGGGNQPPRAVTAVEEAALEIASRLPGFKAIRNRRRQHIKLDGLTREERCRDWVVRKLYPRILFTFSDVICYVTRNIRTIEDIITRLLKWADTALERSVNQPLLPYAIVVINAHEEYDVPSWYEEDLTKRILNEHADISKSPALLKLAKGWIDRGGQVKNLTDLLKYYYCEIEIICIPHYKMANGTFVVKQYQKLHAAMVNSVQNTCEQRNRNGMLLNWNDLEKYLGYAFNHYGKNATSPFDFLKAAFIQNPVRSNFHTHILIAALRLMGSMGTPRFDVFERITPLVASSILLDVYRKKLPRMVMVDEIMDKYSQHLDDAYRKFYSDYWPCGYTDSKGHPCVNVSTKHHKGHQIADGRIVATGGYIATVDVHNLHKESTFSSSTYRLERADAARVLGRELLRSGLGVRKPVNRPLVKVSGDRPGGDDTLATEYSHRTCFACLFSPPSHVLGCGHLVCDNCVDDYATEMFPSDSANTRTIIRLTCPFCTRNSTLTRITRETGARVLSLDGGGVRSILQLKALLAIQQRIGLDIPIQEFFDIVIGTSAGGIIALGLGVTGLSVEECRSVFRDFVTMAFTKRHGVNIPGLKFLVEAHKHSKFRTGGLKGAMKSVFGEDLLFGEMPHNDHLGWNLKVGVTLTATSGHGFLAANYNRPEREKSTAYSFLRGGSREQELKVWEAAMATSAAPRFFKPFHDKRTGHVFSDGGLRFNNPVAVADHERELLWPSHLHSYPDIFLSIGTGHTADNSEEFDKPPGGVHKSHGVTEYFHRLKLIVNHQTNHQLDSQRIWEDHLEKSGIDVNRDTTRKRKYKRLDIKFTSGQLPKLHHVEKMAEFEKEVDAQLQLTDQLGMIEGIAAQLLASLFYLRLDKSEESPNIPRTGNKGESNEGFWIHGI
ncbi:hypothetical protein DFH27DRAFT_486168 [Peziza echinospora]|nr:hypothetical protein DFH27DRAFT_486168 [Peziza echinospora]